MFYIASSCCHLPLEYVQATLDSNMLWDNKNVDSYGLFLKLELEVMLQRELDMMCWAHNCQYEIDWSKEANLRVDVRADVKDWTAETKRFIVIAAFKVLDLPLTLDVWTSDAVQRVLGQFFRETTINFKPLLMKHIDHWDLLGKISRRWQAMKEGKADVMLVMNEEGITGWKWYKMINF